MELDYDTLARAAAEALERPSDAMFYDDRLFTTHGAVFHWAERGDDLLAESNYLTALALITAKADEDRPDTEVSDAQVIDGTSSHWLVGSLRTIYVQVYDDSSMRCRNCGEIATWIARRRKSDRRRFYCEPCKDRWYWDMAQWGLSTTPAVAYRPRFTPAFVEAVELAEYLRGGGAILDDSDYSEREWEAFEKALKEAVEEAQREYVLVDTIEDDEAIAQRFYGDESATHWSQWCRPDDVCWSTVAEEYKSARDAYFLERATEVYRWNMCGYSPDQIELFAA
ncbi:hypothetical protein AB0E27_31385 [Streptomyces sparsogenes]|uniref:hypothetical protein n=1 Tax=Streptomyces sparsogenes TaxID=67365 RepID=UPI0033C80FAE